VTTNRPPVRVLIPFHTAHLYGMEKAVIQTFDCLRPEIQPLFLVARAAQTRRLPVLEELIRRKLPFSFFSDRGEWSRVGWPRSPAHLANMVLSALRGNRDVLRATRNCDALYLPSISYAAYALAAMLYCRATGRRVYHHFHDLPARPQRRLSLLRFLISDHVHNAHRGLEIAVSLYPWLHRWPNHVLPQSVEVPPEEPLEPDAASVLAGSRNVVFVGQVSRGKGVEVLLEAFRIVAAEEADVRLHVVGGLREQSAEQIVDYCERVLFWGYRADISTFLRSAYMCVQPSLPSCMVESFGRAAAEAQALGVPVVCFASGLLPDIVRNGETGLVCDDESAGCLASAILRLLQDPLLRNTMSQNARVRFNEISSIDAIREAWLACLDP